MKAAVVHEFGRPLVIEDIAKPEPWSRPGPRQDRDLRPVPHGHPRRPRRLAGQAGAAVRPRARRCRASSTRVGAGVTRAREGDRVAVPWLGWACGACEACASGWETLCPNAANTGYTVERRLRRVRARRRRLRRARPRRHRSPRRRSADLRRRHHVQGGQGLRRAVVGASSPCSASAVSATSPCSTRAIAGATVVAVDILDSKLEIAEHSAPTYMVNAGEDDPVEAIQRPGRRRRGDRHWPPSPRPASRRSPRCAAAARWSWSGCPPDNTMRLPIFETVLNGIRIVGSLVGTRVDLQETFDCTPTDARASPVRRRCSTP